MRTTVRQARRHAPQSDQHDILPVQYTGDDPALLNLGGGDAVRQVTIRHRLFPSPFRSKSVRALQRGRGQMLADEPDLRFVRADDIADQQVVGAVVAGFVSGLGTFMGLFEHDAMRL